MFREYAPGKRIALTSGIPTEAHTMIWLMERNTDLLVCEIRRAPEGEAYEFEVAPRSGTPETRQYTSPRELIEQYLRTQTTLKAQGWRPKATEVATL